MNGPEGVATDAAGNLYVADFGNNRVQKFQDPFQPDAHVKLASDASYRGVGIVNTTGAGQTRTPPEHREKAQPST
jgi:DNA-binding beta-propeller fold protein YncE